MRPGDSISPWYDPMIAKIVTHGATRAIALRELEAALIDTEVAGSVTNVDFLIALARHDGFGRGEVDTGLIARDLEALVKASEPDPRAKALAVLGLAGLDDPRIRGGVTLWQPLRRTIAWEGGEAVLEVLGPGSARVTLDSVPHLIGYEGGRWWVDGSPRRSRIVNHAAGTSVFGGRSLTLVPLDPLARGGDEAGGGLTLSPMPGLVKAVFVAPGQDVAAGDRLAILEAMKMEHTLTAARDGRVAEVLARAGDQVEAGAPLIRLEEDEA